MVTSNLRNEVRRRATCAASEKEMGGIIFDAIARQELDWREVGSEGVKQLLVDALRAFRGSRETNALRVAV